MSRRGTAHTYAVNAILRCWSSSSIRSAERVVSLRCFSRRPPTFWRRLRRSWLAGPVQRNAATKKLNFVFSLQNARSRVTRRVFHELNLIGFTFPSPPPPPPRGSRFRYSTFIIYTRHLVGSQTNYWWVVVAYHSNGRNVRRLDTKGKCCRYSSTTFERNTENTKIGCAQDVRVPRRYANHSVHTQHAYCTTYANSKLHSTQMHVAVNMYSIEHCRYAFRFISRFPKVNCAHHNLILRRFLARTRVGRIQPMAVCSCISFRIRVHLYIHFIQSFLRNIKWRYKL